MEQVHARPEHHPGGRAVAQGQGHAVVGGHHQRGKHAEEPDGPVGIEIGGVTLGRRAGCEARAEGTSRRRRTRWRACIPTGQTPWLPSCRERVRCGWSAGVGEPLVHGLIRSSRRRLPGGCCRRRLRIDQWWVGRSGMAQSIAKKGQERLNPASWPPASPRGLSCARTYLGCGAGGVRSRTKQVGLPPHLLAASVLRAYPCLGRSLVGSPVSVVVGVGVS